MVTHVVSFTSARSAVKKSTQASVANAPPTVFFKAPVVSHRFLFFATSSVQKTRTIVVARHAMRHGKVESRATHACFRADSLQYVQTRARLGQRGRFIQMSWSTSADHAHFWRIGAARLHALIRNRSAHGHGIQPPASEPRIQMWRALDPHGQHIFP